MLAVERGGGGGGGGEGDSDIVLALSTEDLLINIWHCWPDSLALLLNVNFTIYHKQYYADMISIKLERFCQPPSRGNTPEPECGPVTPITVQNPNCDCYRVVLIMGRYMNEMMPIYCHFLQLKVIFPKCPFNSRFNGRENA